MPAQSLEIDHARYVVTVDRERRIIQDGSILVEDGRIRRVGKAAELADARADRVIDARHLARHPRVRQRPHAHQLRPRRARHLPRRHGEPAAPRVQAADGDDRGRGVPHAPCSASSSCSRAGRSAFVDPGSTKFPDACLQAYEDAGIRVILGECVTDQEAPFPLPRYAGGGGGRAAPRAFIDKWHGRLDGRIRAWAMPFSPETCSAGAAARRSSAWPTSTAPALTLHHNSGAKARAGLSGRVTATARPQYLESLGVLGPNVLLAHALGLDDAEIDCWRARGTAVAMCPVTAAKGGRGVPEHGRMPELLAKGVKIALGCDSPNNSNHLDIVRAMNMAAIQYKDARQDTRQIPAEAALEMATLDGRAGARPRRRDRLDRARQEGRPGALRHAAARSGRRSSTRSTTSSTTPTAAACTPSSSTAGWWSTPTARRSSTSRGSSPRCRRSARSFAGPSTGYLPALALADRRASSLGPQKLTLLRGGSKSL